MRDISDAPFWKTKKLGDMNEQEWESLCDRCGRCCLNKLEDEDTGVVVYTSLACKLFDAARCMCSDYACRQQSVPDCIKVTPENLADLHWLPPSCAYRLIHEGRDLFWWHPLVSGDGQTVHDAGISVRGRVTSEVGVKTRDYEQYVVSWPQRF